MCLLNMIRDTILAIIVENREFYFQLFENLLARADRSKRPPKPGLERFWDRLLKKTKKLPQRIITGKIYLYVTQLFKLKEGDPTQGYFRKMGEPVEDQDHEVMEQIATGGRVSIDHTRV